MLFTAAVRNAAAARTSYLTYLQHGALPTHRWHRDRRSQPGKMKSPTKTTRLQSPFLKKQRKIFSTEAFVWSFPEISRGSERPNVPITRAALHPAFPRGTRARSPNRRCEKRAPSGTRSRRPLPFYAAPGTAPAGRTPALPRSPAGRPGAPHRGTGSEQGRSGADGIAPRAPRCRPGPARKSPPAPLRTARVGRSRHRRKACYPAGLRLIGADRQGRRPPPRAGCPPAGTKGQRLRSCPPTPAPPRGPPPRTHLSGAGGGRSQPRDPSPSPPRPRGASPHALPPGSVSHRYRSGGGSGGGGGWARLPATWPRRHVITPLPRAGPAPAVRRRGPRAVPPQRALLTDGGRRGWRRVVCGSSPSGRVLRRRSRYRWILSSSPGFNSSQLCLGGGNSKLKRNPWASRLEPRGILAANRVPASKERAKDKTCNVYSSSTCWFKLPTRMLLLRTQTRYSITMTASHQVFCSCCSVHLWLTVHSWIVKHAKTHSIHTPNYF